jgi:two-component sensor histidine kinase
VIIRNIMEANNLALPEFYEQHGIISTIDVIIPATDGAPYGVLEVDSPAEHQYDGHDINFLTGFANVLAEAVATAKRNQALRSLLEHQRLLAEELEHRVRNNLHVVGGMLSSYARTVNDDTTRQSIGAISRHVMTLAQIYDSLLGVGLSDSIDLADYLRELCATLPGLQLEHDRKIDLVCEAESISLPLNNVTALGMVVTELVTNSYGHAFPDQDGTIKVTLVRSKEYGKATLTIQDDGVGMVVDLGSSRRGLGLVKRLTKQIGGSLDVHSGDGTLWTLNFDVPVPSNGSRAAA